MRRWLGVLVVGFVLGGASPALASGVSTPNVTTPTTNATGGRTTLVATFSTSAAGALAAGQTITVRLPDGTGFSGYDDSSIVVGGVEVGFCGGTSTTTVTCYVNTGKSIAANAAVTLTLNGVTNPAAGSLTLTVATATDTAVVPSAQYTIGPAHPISTPTVSIANPTDAAGARTIYTIGFTTSLTGAMSYDANSQFTLSFPAGTGFSPGYDDSSVVVGGVEVGYCGGTSTTTLTCYLSSGKSIAATTPVAIVLNGITNPGQGGQSLSVATTSDPAAQPGSYTVGAAHAISAPTVAVATPTNAAGGRTIYTIGFTTSTTGAMSYDANSQFTLAFPAGTGFSPGYDDSSVVVGGAEVGYCGGTSTTTVTCYLSSGKSIAASTPVTIVLNGITNPGQGGQSLSVATTSDPAAQPGSYTVGAAHAISAPTVQVATPTAAAGARTIYTIGFTTSTTGAMSYDANSQFTLVFPAGTGFSPGYDDSSVVVGGAEVGYCGGTSTTTVTCYLSSGKSIAASTPVTIVLNGITNPGQGAQSLGVSTTSDPSPQAGGFSVGAAHPIANLAVQVGTSAPSTPTRYTITFDASTTGAMSYAANSQIRLTFPAGTTFGSAYSDSAVVVGGNEVGYCGGPTGTALTCYINYSQSIAAGASVRVTLTNITNPASGAPWTLSASTTSDPQSVASTPYSQGGAPATTIDSAPAAPTSAPSFAFSSDQPGSAFECSVDSAPFAACTSPYSPSGLSAGVHTFAVRAVGGQAVQRSFTVATPQPQQPTPAPTPTPTPTPVPGKSVVVQPLSGKVLVKRPGTNQFVAVDASQGIPLGSTVDTKDGAVELTAKAGQTAKFYDGIFKITQSGGTTDLTLNEPLAPCRGAHAAKKKPKTRKLWGDGSGSFRTRGQYSAATVRGTKWRVSDSCAGTLTKVAKGVVSVRDNVKGKTILLKAGKQYLAKPRRSA